MNEQTFAILKREPETGSRVREIMGLPDDAWTQIKVSFGTDEIALAEVTFILTAEQLIALAETAAQRVQVTVFETDLEHDVRNLTEDGPPVGVPSWDDVEAHFPEKNKK